jgi:hypothetical protein
MAAVIVLHQTYSFEVKIAVAMDFRKAFFIVMMRYLA